MDCITPRQYLQAAFPPHLLLPDERPVVAYPDSFMSSRTNERVDFYRQMHPGRRQVFDDRPWYVCLSTVEAQRARQVRKRLEDVRTAFILAVDDVGTKSAEPAVRPSCILETSPGNFQWHWFIEPFDVSTPKGQAYFDACLWSLADAGLNDPGFRSASRLARLPGSRHHSGFRARVQWWEPTDCWELEELMQRLGVKVRQPRKSFALKPGRYTALEDVEDPVYLWLADNWKVFGDNDQWVFIECPWREHHTDRAQGSSSTAYSPMDYGRAGSGFKCLHGHCAGRGTADFFSFVWARKNSHGC